MFDAIFVIQTKTIKHTAMKKYNYYYDGTPITKRQFEANVPEDWENDVDEFGTYHWGLYKAQEKDEN